MAKDIGQTTFTRTITLDGQAIQLEIPLSGVTLKTTDGQIINITPSIKQAHQNNKERWEKDHPSEFPLNLEQFRHYCHPHPTQEELERLATGYPCDILDRKNWTSLGIYAQRGCPWGKCRYCGIRVPTGRRLPIPFIIQVLDQAVGHRVKIVSFDDDQFIQNKTWIFELCDQIIEKGLDKFLTFTTMIKVEAGKDKKLLRKLKEANFAKLQIGVESFLPEKIAYFGKTKVGQEAKYVESAKSLIDDCLSLGIIPGVFIILTRPNPDEALLETARELEQVVEVAAAAFRKHQSVPFFGFNDMLMAYPGAPFTKTDGYKRFMAPLSPLEVPQNGQLNLELKALEIPYIYKLRNIFLTSFSNRLNNRSRMREEGTETNETLEHIEDALLSLQDMTAIMATEENVLYELTREFNSGGCFEKVAGEKIVPALNEKLPPDDQIDGPDPGERIKLLLAHKKLSREDIVSAVQNTGSKEVLEALLWEIPHRQEDEKAKVSAKISETATKFNGLKAEMDEEIEKFTWWVKAEYSEILKMEPTKEALAEKMAPSIEKNRLMIERLWPYLRGREALQQQLKWTAQVTRGKK